MNIINSSKINMFYYINDRNKNKRWILSKNLKYPTFLNLYNTNSFKGYLYKLIVQIVFKLGMQKYFVSGIIEGDLEDKYKNIIKKLNGKNYSIFTGTAGENRKIIIELNDGKETQSFIKIPTTNSAKELVLQECKNIKYVEQLDLNFFNIPKVLYSDDEVVAISNIKPKQIINNDDFSTVHFLGLRELYNKTFKKITIQNANPLLGSIENIEKLNNIKLDYSNELDFKIDNLKTNLSKLKELIISQEENIVISFAHCDFTPWNMYVSKDNLYVYDWELASDNVPLLFDFFHYIFQQNVLIKHKSYQEIKSEITIYFKNEILVEIVKTYNLDVNKYYAYYLLINVSYYVFKYFNQKDLHVQALWLIDVWNEALEDLVKNKGKVFEFNK